MDEVVGVENVVVDLVITAVVSDEVAQAEIDRFAVAWDLDTNTERMDDEDKQSFDDLEWKLKRKIMSGDLTVDESGEVLTYKLRKAIGEKSHVTIKLPTGTAVLQFDKHKDKRNIAKLNGFMGSMCGMSPALFGEPMSGPDLKVIQAVANLFLGS